MRKLLKLAIVAISLVVTPLTASAQSTLEKIKSERKITVGISNSKPWGYREQNGEVAGFSPDLIRTALQPLGITKVDIVIAEFGALIPGLVSRRFDAIAAGMYITPSRCESVAFSDPDLSLKDALLVKKGNPSNIHSYEDIAKNPKLTLGTDRGVANYDNAIEAGVPKDRIMLFQGNDAAMTALMTGRIDAATYSVPAVMAQLGDRKVQGIERAAPFIGLVLKDGREKSGYSAIAFRLEDTDLRDAYNKRLKEMKADGTVAAIMKKYGFTDAEAAPELTQAQICAAGK